MEEKILSSILLRPGTKSREDLLRDMIADCVAELKDLLNYKPDDVIPEALYGVVKELVLTQFNLDGVQGIQSESQSSGGSTSYTSDLPKKLKMRIYQYRKLRR